MSGPRRACAIVPGCRSGEWRNWQTRWLQVPVAARSWGFKSPLAHAWKGVRPEIGGSRPLCVSLEPSVLNHDGAVRRLRPAAVAAGPLRALTDAPLAGRRCGAGRELGAGGGDGHGRVAGHRPVRGTVAGCLGRLTANPISTSGVAEFGVPGEPADDADVVHVLRILVVLVGRRPVAVGCGRRTATGVRAGGGGGRELGGSWAARPGGPGEGGRCRKDRRRRR
jgi:hypothetical protein